MRGDVASRVPEGGFLAKKCVCGELAGAKDRGENQVNLLLPMTVQERLAQHLSRTPDIARASWVAANATVVGDVTLGPGSSVFYGAVLRGDIARIVVGEGTNLQDNVIVHLADDLDALIGAWCTVGHGAIIHACTIEDECLIGMGATVLDGARVGARSLIGAGSVVTPRTVIPPGSMVMGTPARVVRALSAEEQAGLKTWAEKYVPVSAAHAARERAIAAAARASVASGGGGQA